MCWICLQRTGTALFEDYKTQYTEGHDTKVQCIKERSPLAHTVCECIDCSYNTSLRQTEHSLLVYLCDAMDYAPLAKVPDLLLLARQPINNYHRSDWFLQQLYRFEGITTVEELRAASKKLRKDLL